MARNTKLETYRRMLFKNFSEVVEEVLIECTVLRVVTVEKRSIKPCNLLRLGGVDRQISL